MIEFPVGGYLIAAALVLGGLLTIGEYIVYRIRQRTLTRKALQESAECWCKAMEEGKQ